MNDRKQQLLEFLKETPHDPFLKYALTMEYLKEDNTSEALRGFEDLINLHPDYVGTYYHFGKFLEKQGDLSRALEVYKRGMEIARLKRNMHALSELQGAYNLASGEMDEDEDY